MEATQVCIHSQVVKCELVIFKKSKWHYNVFLNVHYFLIRWNDYDCYDDDVIYGWHVSMVMIKRWPIFCNGGGGGDDESLVQC